MEPVPERTPAYTLIECEACGGAVWYRLSRVDPMAWTKADFEAEHVIDFEAGTVVRREK